MSHLHTSFQGKKLFSNLSDPSFIRKGFHNWKDATLKFRACESSNTHKEAVLKIVGEAVLSISRREKMEKRQVLLNILSNVRFLGRQGFFFFCGDGDESDSNFMQLFHL